MFDGDNFLTAGWVHDLRLLNFYEKKNLVMGKVSLLQTILI